MKKYIPGYAVVPIIGMLMVNAFTYFITPLWTNRLYHYSMVTKFDEMLPFVSVFVLPYILAYVQWIVGYLLIARTDKEYCLKIFRGEILAKILVCIIFIVLPTTMERAVVTDDGLCSMLVEIIYKMDSPVNLFPSIHCLESWICFRSSLNQKYFSVRYMTIMGVMTLFVILSTVFIKQHVIMDAIGAIIVAEMGLLAGKITWRSKGIKSKAII